jgi:hypothetical protein
MKVVRFLALSMGRLNPYEISLVLVSGTRLVRPQGHNAALRITSTKNPNDNAHNALITRTDEYEQL